MLSGPPLSAPKKFGYCSVLSVESFYHLRTHVTQHLHYEYFQTLLQKSHPAHY